MFDPEINVAGYDGREYRIARLTPEVAEENTEALLDIHNLIPHVTWGPADLMGEVHTTGAPYKNKWKLSSITYCGDEVVSFMTAWERSSTETHPLDSIYLHRMGVRPDHQRNGVARHIMRNAIDGFAQEIPEVSTYTLQTNDVESNKKALDFYESLGFERLMPVYYPDKLDVLMQLSREAVLASIAARADAPVSSS